MGGNDLFLALAAVHSFEVLGLSDMARRLLWEMLLIQLGRSHEVRRRMLIEDLVQQVIVADPVPQSLREIRIRLSWLFFLLDLSWLLLGLSLRWTLWSRDKGHHVVHGRLLLWRVIGLLWLGPFQLVHQHAAAFHVAFT